MRQEFIISNATDLLRVSADDIMCIQADGNYSLVTITDGDERLVLFQLGQLEHMLNSQLGDDASMFIRIGRGIIMNRDYLYAINLPKQHLVLRSPSGHKVSLTASRESLRQLKRLIDNNISKGDEKQ
ncbi:MAG: LytTR family DNA-binding domain-containing protein [Prevotella sp.]